MALVNHRDQPATASPDAVRWLDEPDACVAPAVGAKAAALARARRGGLPVVDGFVIPVGAVAGGAPHDAPGAHAAWAQLSEAGTVSLVVRSSSPVEDLAASSMAGQFTSVLDVLGWDEFVDACHTVAESARGEPMAVLVQRQVFPELGGVLFGVDPVSGRTDHRSIAAVAGGPHDLVGGQVQGHQIVVDRHNRVRSTSGDPTPVLRRTDRRHLLHLADRAATRFGGPQDIEWAIERGRLLLLQSRPVTAMAPTASGPVLGPGPVAETFPDALSPLEADLWVPPLREGMTEALALTGAVGRRRLASSPVATVVDGQVAVDLEVTGARGGRRSLFQVLDPRPPLRRLASAWTVGRLRVALPRLGQAVMDETDRELASVPPVDELDDEDLLRLLDNAGALLRALHGHEILAGALIDDAGETGAAAAMRAIARGRAAGWSDDDIVARAPVSLALLAPRIGARPPLPEVSHLAPRADPALSLREALRLRVRWVHELSARAALELGCRLQRRGALVEAGEVAALRRQALAVAVRGGPVELSATVAGPTPLPAAFRLGTDGRVVPVTAPDESAAVGAGGGRGRGSVVHSDASAGDVLVVRTLDPALAPILGRLGGLVAETGSPLSHLAILAREHGVPVVVGYEDALARFAPGTEVIVDGTAGTVEVTG